MLIMRDGEKNVLTAGDMFYKRLSRHIMLPRKAKSRLMTKKRIRTRQPESDRAAVRFPSLDPPPRPTGHSLTAGSQCHTHVTSSYARAIETHAAPPHHFQRMDCHEKVMIISIEILELFARYF